MTRRAAAFLIAVALSSPAFGQDAEQAKPPPQRIINAEVYGDDACPTGAADEVVVCARLPESERFRLPKRFREAKNQKPNTAWATRVESMDEIGRVAGGLPNTCSTIGSGGATGCTQQMIDAWYADRRARASEMRAADEYEGD